MTRERKRSGEIGLGELVQALASLQPDPEAAEAIAASMGMLWVQAQSALASRVGPSRPPGDAPSSPIPPSRPGTGPLTPIELQPVRSATSRFELMSSAVLTVASGPLAPADTRAESAKPPYQPLFRDRSWRALARAMFATPTVTRALDLRLIMKHIQTGSPADRLPWALKATLRRGAVLILDHSESMQPFWRDQRELVERCKRVIGAPGVRSYWVETDSWSENHPRLRWLHAKPEHLPAQVPVVIVSDFELGKELTPRWPLLTPWLPLIQRANSAGVIVLAVVPINRALWPAALTDAIPNAIPWDHTTTTGDVRHSIL